jgi:hypothetical protein
VPEFIPGIQLSEAFYWEAVRPILAAHFPNLPHSAALIGYGSDVLGYDTAVSTDHLWGPRLLLFLRPEDLTTKQQAIHEALRHELPARFRGYSTHFGKPDPDDKGVRISEDLDHGPVDHLVLCQTIDSFWRAEIGFPADQTPTPADWLTFPTQQLLRLTAGKVFHDDLGLEEARQRFAYYPRDVWLYLLAAQWHLIGEQEAFVGRTWSVGDELGSKLVAASIVERLIRLCFLMEKTYPPYSKWFGTAFQRLACYPRIGPPLEAALAANAYPEREKSLAQAYTIAAEMQNALGERLGIPAQDPRTRTYSGWHRLRGYPNLPYDYQGTRPHQVIFASRFEDAISAAIRDPQVLALIPGVGSVDQALVESSGALQNLAFCRGLKDDFGL